MLIMATKVMTYVKKSPVKIITAALVLALLLLGVAAFLLNKPGADGENAIPDTSGTMNGDTQYLDIVAANLEYRDYLYMDYALKVNSLPEGASEDDIKMLFWNSGKQEYELGTESYSVTNAGKTSFEIDKVYYNDCLRFVSNGIAAKEIGDVIYARACVTVAGSNYYSEVVKFSVLDYVYSRYRDKEAGIDIVTDDQMKLYNAILQYGANAQVILDYNKDRLVSYHGARIEIGEGAYLSDGFTVGTYILGDNVKIIASTNTDYGDFEYWLDSAGENVGENVVLEFQVTEETKSEKYTPVYSNSALVNVKGGKLANGETSAVVFKGSELVLNAIAPSEKHVFSHWKVGETQIPDSIETAMKVQVPSGGSVTYEAVYIEPVKVTVIGGTFADGLRETTIINGESVTVYADDESKFKCWQDGNGNEIGETPTCSIEVNTSETTYTIEAVNHSPVTVSVTNGSGSGVYEHNAQFTITADDKTGGKLKFKHWKDGNGNFISDQATYSATVNATKGNTLNFVAEYYDPITVTVVGGTVTVGNEEPEERATVIYGGRYTVKATPPDYYEIDSWKKNELTDQCTGESEFTTTSEEDVTYTAIFKVSDSRYAEASETLDPTAVKALIEMDKELFSEDVYLWLAELYDPETSAFYFSISGRDNYGYLPDIETTSQASGLMQRLFGYSDNGLAPLYNDAQKAALLSWAQSLQSNRDGYNYHPHWGVSVIDGRRSRDYTYVGSSYNASGVYAFRLYNNADYRISNGTGGLSGVTESVRYNNSSVSLVSSPINLTSPLGISARSAASKVILVAATSSESSTSHLSSEQAFVTELNARWNLTCSKTGTHDMHICDSTCTSITKDDQTRFRIYIDDAGKVVFARGEKCNKGHTCEHELGHSYAFGHNFGTQLTQIKSANLGDVLVNYYYNLQENVQESLRSQGKAENGIWEETVNYTTISGLLKICGTPGHFEKEFKYAEAAINSALECAKYTVDNFVEKGEAIVSIYNPYNAISAILSNIDKYGSDKTAATRCRAKILNDAAELINNAKGKLEKFHMKDGGFSYNMSGYCVNSQGQPVAIEGWVNRTLETTGEGDVNGTALAFGTRSAILSALEISVGAPFAGDGNKIAGGFDLNGDGDILDSFDLDGDNGNDISEETCTHSQRLQYLLTTKSQIKKVDVNTSEYTYTFEDGVKGSGGEIVAESDNKVFEVVDNSSSSGATATFNSSIIASEENNTEISFDMKLVSCTQTTTTHQIFVDGTKGRIFQINMPYNSGTEKFSLVAVIEGVSKKSLNISVAAKKWFTVSIVVDTEGYEVNGTKYYGKVEVTQEGVTQSAYIPELTRNEGYVTKMSMFSLKDAKTTTRYDNICVTSNVLAGVHDGEYHFDTATQKIAGADILVENPLASYDTVYLVEKKAENDNATAVFNAFDYSTTSYKKDCKVNYNFDSAQLDILLKDAKNDERIDIVMLDKKGNRITGIYLTVSEEDGNKFVTFHAPNGQALQESIPRIVTDSTTGRQTTVQELRDMKLDVNTAKWMTVKLEYHYDMRYPQFDILVRYADDTKSGYYTSVAACLTGVDVCDSGADPYSFAKLSVTSTAKIYLDDLYIRNVYHEVTKADDGYCNTHVFIEKVANAYKTGNIDEFNHPIYYTSCQKCGLSSADTTFSAHEYVNKVDSNYLAWEANYDLPETYWKSCSICGTQSETETFSVGKAVDYPDKWGFDPSEGEDKKPAFITESTGTGMGSAVMEEEVGEVVNYYLNVYKKENTGSNLFKFAATSAGSYRYVYEFDFRWQGASNHITDIIYVKVGTTSSGEKGNFGTFQASADGTFASYLGRTFNKGEWHNIKFVYDNNNGTWSCKIYIDGSDANNTKTFTGNGVPYVMLETRYKQYDGENDCDLLNNISFDLDNLVARASCVNGHEYSTVVDDKYIVSSAGNETTYKKSCSVCGEEDKENNSTFTIVDYGTHDFSNVSNEDLPNTLYASNFGSVVTGLDESIKQEGDNSYLHIGKEAVNASNHVVIKMNDLYDESFTTYTAEFDFRWLGASEKETNTVFLFKFLAANVLINGAHSGSFNGDTASINSDLKFGSQYCELGEWTSIKVEFKETAENVWTAVISVNGTAAATNPGISSVGVPQFKIETRYGTGYTMAFDIDNYHVYLIEAEKANSN